MTNYEGKSYNSGHKNKEYGHTRNFNLDACCLFQAKTLKQIEYQQKQNSFLKKKLLFFSQSLEQRGHFTLACKYNMIRLCKFDKKKIDFYE